MGSQSCISHGGRLCLLTPLSHPHGNEIKRSSFSSNMLPIFTRSHFLTKGNRWFHTGMYLLSSYQAHRSSLSTSFPHPSPRRQQECCLSFYLWVVFLCMLLVPSSCISQEFHITDFFLLYSVQWNLSLFLNPSTWLFNIGKSLPLKWN